MCSRPPSSWAVAGSEWQCQVASGPAASMHVGHPSEQSLLRASRRLSKTPVRCRCLEGPLHNLLYPNSTTGLALEDRSTVILVPSSASFRSRLEVVHRWLPALSLSGLSYCYITTLSQVGNLPFAFKSLLCLKPTSWPFLLSGG